MERLAAGPEQQLILLSAGTLARRQAMADRARGLLAGTDSTTLTQTLQAQRLLPTLGPRIVELVGDREIGAGFEPAVEHALAQGRRHGALLALVGERIVARLGQAGISAAPLKGPLLGEAIYGDPGRRNSTDIDLLVHPSRLADAVEVVRGLGYRLPSDYVGRDHLPLLHFTLMHDRGELPPVELHWRIHWYEREFASERLLPPRARQPAGWRAKPVDELAALLLFYARDGFVGLRLAADIGAWWDSYGAQVQPGAFDALLRRFPALRRAIIASATVAENVVGLPATHILTTSEGTRERVAASLANPLPHTSKAQLYAEVGLVDWLLTPPAGMLAVIRRQILLPRQVRAERARRSGAHREISAIGHCIRVIGRYAVALARLLRGQRFSRFQHSGHAHAGIEDLSY